MVNGNFNRQYSFTRPFELPKFHCQDISAFKPKNNTVNRLGIFYLCNKDIAQILVITPSSQDSRNSSKSFCAHFENVLKSPQCKKCVTVVVNTCSVTSKFYRHMLKMKRLQVKTFPKF